MEMIRRYDEVLLEKANKTSIKDIHENLKLYSRKSKIEKMQTDIDTKFDEVSHKHENLQATLKYLSENINKEIQSAVRKSAATLKA
jgi:uncharacterized protein YeeX (DUF496 family)